MAVASIETPARQLLAQMQVHFKALPAAKQALAHSLFDRAEAALADADTEATAAHRSRRARASRGLTDNEHTLANIVGQLFEVFGIGELATKSLRMHDTQYLLIVSLEHGKLAVQLGSRRKLLVQLVQNAIQQERAGAARAELLDQIRNVGNELGQLIEFENADDYSKMSIERIRSSTDFVAAGLDAIGAEFSIDDLANLGHPPALPSEPQLAGHHRKVVAVGQVRTGDERGRGPVSFPSHADVAEVQPGVDAPVRNDRPAGQVMVGASPPTGIA